MMVQLPLLALGWSLLVGTSSATATDVGHTLKLRNAPGTTSDDTLRAVGRSLHRMRDQSTQPVQNSTTLDKSWNDVTLFSYNASTDTSVVKPGDSGSVSGGIEVVCTQCYVKGNATAHFSIDKDFDFCDAIGNFTEDVGDEILNVTETAADYVVSFIKAEFDDLSDLDFDGVDLPPLNVSFDVDVPDIPQCQLSFEFDGLELYLALDMALSAAGQYKLNLYTSNSPIGLSLSDDLFIGVVFAVDLILSADVDVDISSGVHIKVEDGLALHLGLLSQNVSDITFNGADLEFLPVTVEGAGGLVHAILQLSAHAGFSIDDSALSSLDIPFLEASAGVEASVFANIADLTTNITAASEDAGDDDCALRIVQAYELGLGAAAGATLAFNSQTWGPNPSTNIPIFYTTLADVCAIQGTKTIATSAPAITARAGDDDLTTTTLSQAQTYTGTGCLSPGLTYCPISLQTIQKVTSTKTIVTAVPSGSVAQWPESTQTGDVNTITFGTDAQKIEATSGSPTSYVPPPPRETNSPVEVADHVRDEVASGLSGADKRLAIGLGVGLGVPFLIAIFAGIFFCCRKRKYTSVPNEPKFDYKPQPYQGSMSSRSG